MAERLVFDLIANDSASTGFAAAGRSAAAASDDVQALTKRLDEIAKKSVKAKVGLDGDKDADLKLDQMGLKLLKLGRTVASPKITLDGALRASVEIKGLELELDKLDRKSASISGSGSGLSRLQVMLGGLFAAGGSAGQGGGGILGAFSDMIGSPAGIAATLSVVAAAGAPLLVEAAGLVSGFAAAGGAIGAFGLLALPTFKNIASAYTGISAAHQKYMDALAKEKQDPTKANAAGVTRALDALRVAQDNLSPSTKTAVGGIQALDTEYHKMVTAFAPDALRVFNDALGIANTLLPDVQPFADTASTAIDGLLKKVGVFFKSADFKTWLGSFDKIAGPALTAIGDNLGKVGVSAGKLLTVMSSKDVVHAINIAFDTINGVLIGTADTIRVLMSAWDTAEADVKLHTQQLVTFFTSTVPTGLEIFRNNTRLVWDQVELDVLHMASTVTGTMGKLPGPLGAPFRTAHAAIGRDLAGIEANVANTQLQINRDWAKIHDTASIAVRADGTFKVGTTGPVARAAGGLITGGTPGRDSVLAALMPGEVVVPTRMVSAGAVDHLRGQLPGFASGGVVGSYSGSVPGLAPWMAREETATQVMLEKLTAAATAAAMKAGPASGGGHVNWTPGGGTAQWRPVVLSALSQLGLSSGLVLDVLYQMLTESGGNPSAVNRTDSNWLAGHPSVGLMQVIAGTFAANAGPYRNTGPFAYGVSEDPMANVYAALHYGAHNGRGFGTGPGQIGSGHGYAAGTGGAAPGWARVGEQGTELVRFHGGEEVLPHSMTSRILSGTIGMPGYAAGTKPSPQQAKWLAELARDVASRDKLAVARTRSDHARQLALTAEELAVLQHPHSKADARKLAAARGALGKWEARSLAPISFLNKEITLLRTLTGNPDAVKYGGPGAVAAAAAAAAADAAAAATGDASAGTAAAPSGPAPGIPVTAVGAIGGPMAWPGALPPPPSTAYAGPVAGVGAPSGQPGGGCAGGQMSGQDALISEIRAMHRGIIAAVSRVAPGVSAGTAQALNGLARGVVST